MKTPDLHGNVLAREGCDRCACGCKYWEHDRCIDCGAGFVITGDRDSALALYPNDARVPRMEVLA